MGTKACLLALEIRLSAPSWLTAAHTQAFPLLWLQRVYRAVHHLALQAPAAHSTRTHARAPTPTPTPMQVAHDVGTHCVLAEASLRIGHAEEAITKLKHDELLTQVRLRWPMSC